MEENVQDPEQGGRKAAGFRIFIQISRPSGVAIWCGDMGGYPLHGTGPGGSPIPGRVVTDGAAVTVEFGWKVGVHLGVGGERGGRV